MRSPHIFCLSGCLRLHQDNSQECIGSKSIYSLSSWAWFSVPCLVCPGGATIFLFTSSLRSLPHLNSYPGIPLVFLIQCNWRFLEDSRLWMMWRSRRPVHRYNCLSRWDLVEQFYSLGWPLSCHLFLNAAWEELIESNSASLIEDQVPDIVKCRQFVT